jgi:hypothetical protein
MGTLRGSEEVLKKRPTGSCILRIDENALLSGKSQCVLVLWGMTRGHPMFSPNKTLRNQVLVKQYHARRLFDHPYFYQFLFSSDLVISHIIHLLISTPMNFTSS